MNLLVLILLIKDEEGLFKFYWQIIFLIFFNCDNDFEIVHFRW
jgi:hypothetical protein